MGDTNQIIGATIQVDAGNSNANIKEVNKNLGDVRSSLKDTGATAVTTGSAIEGAGGSFGKLKDQMSALPGPLGEAGEGVNKLSSAFKALLANPVVLIITAIVAALTLLYKAFTNTFEGGEKMEQVFSGIKAAAQALFDNIGHIASALVKFFSFDFSGAVAEIKGVVTAATDAYDKMSSLTKQAQELHKQQLATDLDAAKRAGALADLREKIADPATSAKEKIKLGKELLDDEIKNGQAAVDLAKQVTDNKIAQLKIGQDGEKKNQDEINKLNIDQTNAETAHSNELRRLQKANTAAEKQELADRKAAHEKAVAEAKARQQELVDFTNKIAKIRQDTALAGIVDAYAKEKQQLEDKIADDKRTNDVAFQAKKITRDQYDQLNLALDDQAAVQRAALTDKHNKDVATKEAAFQKDLQGILAKIKEDGETNARAAELVKIKAEHDQRLADAEKTYKDDATKLQTIKDAIDALYKAEKDKLDAKNVLEDAQKKLKIGEEAQKAIINNQKAAYAARLKAIDDEQALVKKAFDDKVITELDYNTKVDELAKARTGIKKEEQKTAEEIEQAVSDTFGNLSELAGKQTAAGKAFAIAQTTMSTYSSAIKAYDSMSSIPFVGPVLGGIAAAAAIANGLAAVKKIVAVDVPGQGSGGSGSAPTAPTTTAAPVAPVQQGVAINSASANAIGNATSNRTYVLDSDVQNSADRNARLNRAARLGE